MPDVRRTLLLSALAWTTVACTAPIVLPTKRKPIDPARFPHGTELLTLDPGDGVPLRGVFVPAPPGADRRGIVVHFLPTGASIAGGIQGSFAGIGHTLRLLAAAGWCSLVVDYRGVGSSGGDRDADRLGGDARVVLAEARRRRSGAEPLVVRGVSLGSLPAASLLGSGADDLAVVLYAPVRSVTVVASAAVAEYGTVLGTLLAWFHRSPAAADLVEVLPRARRALVVLGDADRYLPAADRDRLQAAARDGHIEVRTRTGHDHDQLTLRAFGFELDGFSGRLVDALPAEERAFLAALRRR